MFRFEVKAAEEVVIAISRIPANFEVHTVEIEFGAESNSRTVIRNGIDGDELAGVTSQGILNADHAVWLWVSWEKGNVQAGHGSRVGSNLLVEHMMEDLGDIGNLAITSGGAGKAEWIIPHEADVPIPSKMSFLNHHKCLS